MDQALAWRVEQACHNAWPSLRSALIGDWLLRFGDGVSRRINSANPLHAGVSTIAPQLEAFDRLYRAQGLPLIVRLVSLLPTQVERELDARGFTAEGEACSLYRELAPESFAAAPPDVTIAPHADAEWLSAIARLQAQSPSHASVYARVVDAVALPTGFVALRHDGRIVATAYSVLHGDLVVIESVVVDEALRGPRPRQAPDDRAARLGRRTWRYRRLPAGRGRQHRRPRALRRPRLRPGALPLPLPPRAGEVNSLATSFRGASDSSRTRNLPCLLSSQ